MTATLGVAAGEADNSSTTRSASRLRSSPFSPRIAALIRASVPDYEKDAPRDDAEDMTGVIVMDPFNVTEQRMPSAIEWDFLNDTGRAAHLKERYKGAAVPGDPLSDMVYNYGMLMLREDVRLTRLKELDGAAGIYRTHGDPEDWKKLKKELKGARMRPNDWKAESMDKSYNNHRR